jgi:hypothetical protein
MTRGAPAPIPSAATTWSLTRSAITEPRATLLYMGVGTREPAAVALGSCRRGSAENGCSVNRAFVAPMLPGRAWITVKVSRRNGEGHRRTRAG